VRGVAGNSNPYRDHTNFPEVADHRVTKPYYLGASQKLSDFPGDVDSRMVAY